MATVVAIEPCPTIEPGSGRVVLATVNHLNKDIRELAVSNEDGERTKINPAGLHKFLCASDNEWRSTRELKNEKNWLETSGR